MKFDIPSSGDSQTGQLSIVYGICNMLLALKFDAMH